MNFKLSLVFIFISSSYIFSQSPCKKIVLKACINHEALLHIKNGVLTWEIKEKCAPGEHKECGGSYGATQINKIQWKDSRSPFHLDFNTNGLDVLPSVLQKNNISELIQKPSESNGWETIWRFFDPADLPHSYSISFMFCPPGYTSPPKKAKTEIKKDSLKETKPETKIIKKREYTEDIICKVSFHVGKNIITKKSEIELGELADLLKVNDLLIEISGYKNSNSDLKLYEDRSIIINNFLVDKGIAQKRIKYIGYGESDKKISTQKTIKCCIIIN